MAYIISCSACAFREAVEDEATVFTRKEAHEAESGTGHRVSLEGADGQPLLRGGASDDW